MLPRPASASESNSTREVARLLAAGASIIAMTDTDVAETIGYACSVTLLMPDGQVRVLMADHDLLAACGGCATAELR